MSADPGLARLNALDGARLERELHRCFGSSRWARELVKRAPFPDLESLEEAAAEAWGDLSREEWVAAIHEHPRIGDTGVARRFRSTARWSRGEQSGMADADPATRTAITVRQVEYETRFGHTFLICATGRSGAEILSALEERLRNDPETELAIAATELRKIAALRLHKLLAELAGGFSREASA